MKAEMTKDLQKKVDKYGSVLAAFRSQGGGGKGLAAGGISLMVAGVLIGLLLLLVNVKVAGCLAIMGVFALPGLAMFVPGIIMDKRRQAGYLEFFQKETGYSQEELKEADRELLGQGAVKIVCKTDRMAGKKETAFIVTEHYFLSVWPARGCYLRKLDDIVAAFYSNEIPGIGGYRQGLFVITRQDTRDKGVENVFTHRQYRGFENGQLVNQKDCREICDEVIAEMVARAPHIITSQNIIAKGVRYNLLSMESWQRDWANILEG